MELRQTDREGLGVCSQVPEVPARPARGGVARHHGVEPRRAAPQVRGGREREAVDVPWAGALPTLRRGLARQERGRQVQQVLRGGATGRETGGCGGRGLLTGVTVIKLRHKAHFAPSPGTPNDDASFKIKIKQSTGLFRVPPEQKSKTFLFPCVVARSAATQRAVVLQGTSKAKY